jgi:hypothetical protein
MRATTTIYPEPRPNDGHSSASDLVSSARDAPHGAAVVVLRVVAAALADGPERDHPEVAATLLEDRPEEDRPEEDRPEGSRLELAAWTLVAHGRQREEP